MLTLDHLVIVVNDLASAVADYEQLGFTVTPGGTHADGLTHNALVAFGDGSYLELIAFIDPTAPRDNVWGWRALAQKTEPLGGGLIDYCMAADDLQAEVAALRTRGLQINNATEGGRQRPDGATLRWRSARFWQTDHALPFLIEDVTPRDLRVPSGPAAQHANSATGIGQLTIAVANLERMTADFASLTGVTPGPREDDRRLEATTVSFPLGQQTLRLAEPSGPYSPVQHQLETTGLGPFEVTMTKLNRRGVMLLDPKRSHGVRIWL
jgi:hypothetical protein